MTWQKKLLRQTICLILVASATEGSNASLENNFNFGVAEIALSENHQSLFLDRLPVYKEHGICSLSVSLSPADLTSWRKVFWTKYFSTARSLGIRFKVNVISTEVSDQWVEKNHSSISTNTLDCHRDNSVSIWSPSCQQILLENTKAVVSFLDKADAIPQIDEITVDLGPHTTSKTGPAAAADFWFYEPCAHKDFAQFVHRKYTTLSKLNKIWHEKYKNWEEIKIPSPHTKTGTQWSDVLSWYRESKRHFAKFQIENYRCAIKRAGADGTIKLLIPTVSNSVNAKQWLDAVNSGEGDAGVANMDDSNYLYSLAEESGCGIDLYSSEQGANAEDLFKSGLRICNVPTWIECSKSDLKNLEVIKKLGAAGVFVIYSKSSIGADGIFPPNLEKLSNAQSVQINHQPPTTGTSKLDEPWWADRHIAILQKLSEKNFDILFVGDSITQNWEHQSQKHFFNTLPVWKKYYANRGGLNLGFSADSTENAIWRLENGELGGAEPKICIVNIGVNDIFYYKKSTKQVLKNIQRIVEQITENNSTNQVILIGILPTKINEQVSQATNDVNASLERFYSNDKNVQFLNGNSALRKNNDLINERFVENFEDDMGVGLLHPTSDAMLALARLIEPKLQQAYLRKQK